MELALRIGFLIFLLLSGIQNTHAGTIQRGQECVPPGGDPGPPANWPNLDATCVLGPTNTKCRPGPARPGQPQAWYCVKEDYDCSYPGSVGDKHTYQRGDVKCMCPPEVDGIFCHHSTYATWCALVERYDGTVLNHKEVGSQSEANDQAAGMKSDSERTTGEKLLAIVKPGGCP